MTAANRHDVTQLLELVDGVPEFGGVPGGRRKRPKTLLADRGYDSEPHRDELRARGIEPRIAKRRTKHGSGLGTERWVVERTIAWLHRFRRLRIRWERRADIHEAFLMLGCVGVCWRALGGSFC